MRNKNMYCGICEKVTEHKFKGNQEGVPGKTLEIYDCVQCRDTCGRWMKVRDTTSQTDKFNLKYGNQTRTKYAQMGLGA